MNFILYVIVTYIIIYVHKLLYEDAVAINTNFFNSTTEDKNVFLLRKIKNCISEKESYF